MIVLPSTPTDPEHGRIGWRSLVTATNVSSSSQEPGFPALNLANPNTSPSQCWRAADTGATDLTVLFGALQTVDYIGLARHNFGTAGVGYTLEGTIDGSTWNPLDAPQAPNEDSVIIHEFPATELAGVRLALGAGVVPAQAAVLYVGAITRLQRRIYVGHTPLSMGRQTTVSTGMSESGQFLGRVVSRREYRTQIQQQNLDPTWYRDELDPFSAAAATQPFFWAWRPAAYPFEVGFAWATDDPQAQNDRANGMMGWSLRAQGIIA